jgi:hypothetical protein
MSTGKPLFTGVSETDQIKKIFRIRGTPNEKDYPDLSTFPDWNASNFDVFPEEDITKFVPNLDEDGIDLLLVLLLLI